MFEFLIQSKVFGNHWIAVSDADKEKFNVQDGYDWSKQWKLARSKGKMYVYRKTHTGEERLTKFLTGLSDIEHIDGNCYNYQRENLRQRGEIKCINSR